MNLWVTVYVQFHCRRVKSAEIKYVLCIECRVVYNATAKKLIKLLQLTKHSL